MPKVLDIAALDQKISQGIGVAFEDVEGMFDIVKAGGSAAALTAAQARVVELEAELKAATANDQVAEITRLTGLLNGTQAQIDAVNAQTAAVAAERDAAVSAKLAGETRIGELEVQVEQAGAALEKADAAITALNAKIDELQAAIGGTSEPPVAAPVALDHTFTTDDKTTLANSIAITGGLDLTYSVIGALPVGLMLNGDGSFNYTPVPGVTGAVVFDYSAADGQGNSDTGSVTIDVTASV